MAPMSDQSVGLLLAVSSSVFIGSSFIIKKRGLRMAGSTGLRAGGAQRRGGRNPHARCGCYVRAAGREGAS